MKENKTEREAKLEKALKELVRHMESICASACARRMSVRWMMDDTEALQRAVAVLNETN